ncbi:non-specific phospholipase C1-like [Pyrus ussuriensis x Pyrus communis]|uniref:Non-specific phospholipase C1-like n=1 Tax=Pyrus ussuriensis x Pyrus communis TaxID=2448454 RepID=A0A5N5G1V6_9ROSA|nr:non-specific phospholipase C1-like [Pyrus ussuriensis x Pyrus communis]
MNNVDLNGDESNSISVSEPDLPRVRVFSDPFFVDSDPGHSFQVQEAINEKKRLIFTGHSIGSPIAVLSTI